MYSQHVNQQLHQTNKNNITITWPQYEEQNSKEPMITPRASSLSYNWNVILDKNRQGSQWGLLAYHNNEQKYKLDEINTFIIKKIL